MSKEVEKKTVLSIKVFPNASTTKIIGYEGTYLKIHIKPPPDKNKANKALIKLLSKELKTPQSQIHIIKGEKARIKTILIDGFQKEELPF
jgi:uncharacterized protein